MANVEVMQERLEINRPEAHSLFDGIVTAIGLVTLTHQCLV